MEQKGNEVSVMEKIAAFIVDKRNLFFLIYAAAFIFSLFSSNWVRVCDDLSSYLPESTETRRGLTVMEDEFTTYSTERVMIINTTYAEAESLSEKIKELPEVGSVEFDDTADHYSDTCALINVTLKGESGSDTTANGYAAIDELLKDYDTYSIKSDADDSESLAQEMNIVLVVAAVIIIGVLLLTSQTYMEVPVMLITFVAAAILNKGTNFMFGEISFVSNSVTVVLQLALSIDYAIILIHRYSEERETYDQHDAIVQALSKAIVEISSSSLTTVSGLAALMFMHYRIGFDMGMVLIKSIIFSLLCVFTLMPCLLMLFGKYIDKTHHKSFVPKISKLGDVVYHLRFIVPIVFVGIIVLGYILSSKCPFVYGTTTLSTSRKNETQIAQEMVESRFGADNLTALIVPKGQYDKEKQLIRDLENRPEVKSVTGLSNVTAKDDYVLTDKLTPRQFAELADIDIELSKLVYGMYAADHEDYGRLINNINNYGVPLIDMFAFVYDLKEDGFVTFDDDLTKDLDDLNTQLSDAKLQLMGDTYTRILVYLNLPEEGGDTFKFIDEMHNIAANYYDRSSILVVGNSTSDYDLSDSFALDNVVISILSVLFVIIVLLFTFNSVGLPILLIAIIQGSVWINFSFPYVTSSNLFFLSYLIVSSIQMGANIDYAIVISGRYLEMKKIMPLKDAMREALNFAFPTVLTSGSILASAGFLISKLSTNAIICSIGTCLGRGTIISMFLVMCVLPEILLLGDIIIERTSFAIKKPAGIKNDTGVFMLNGRTRGYINGFVDANIHGLVKGDIKAQISIDNISNAEEDKSDDKE